MTIRVTPPAESRREPARLAAAPASPVGAGASPQSIDPMRLLGGHRGLADRPA